MIDFNFLGLEKDWGRLNYAIILSTKYFELPTFSVARKALKIRETYLISDSIQLHKNTLIEYVYCRCCELCTFYLKKQNRFL